MELKSIIIDDEQSARETLAKMLIRYTEGVSVVGEADSIVSGLELIRSTKIDVLFLDIRLGVGNGFELLERLEEINFEVIFTTAYDKYALKAIKFSAIDYLLKPLSPADLKIAIEKVRRRKEKEGDEKENQRLGAISGVLKSRNEQTKMITLSTSDGMIVVQLKDIIRCEGFKNYTTFHLSTGEKILVSRTLKEFEKMFEKFDFLRIFQSHLVNQNYITKYNRGIDASLEMADGTILPVSRAKKNILIQRMKEF